MQMMFLSVILMLAFPFAADGYQLFSSDCSYENFQLCHTFRQSFFLRGTIINAILNSLMIALMAFSMFHSRNKKSNSIQAKAERRLIYQAIASSFFLIICFSLKFASAKTIKSQFFLFMIFMYISNTVYHIHHLVVMGLHFLLSHSFRSEFLKFYHLTFLLPKVAITTINEYSRQPTPTKIMSSQRNLIL